MAAMSGCVSLLLLGCAFPGAITDPARNPQLRQVNGLVGGDVLLPLNESSAQLVSKIEWTFQTESGGARLIAEFRNEQWARFNSSFGTRLETAEKTVLRIRDLEVGDSGEYKAQVTLSTAQIKEHTFRLAVYEPVPEPELATHLISSMPDGCNLTLRCQAVGKGGFNISWEMGTPPRTLDGGSDWYHLSADGANLHVSWRSTFSDANITCLASNPADEKKTSFDVRSICSGKGGNQSRNKWPVLVSLCVVAFILATAGGVWLLKRRQKR